MKLTQILTRVFGPPLAIQQSKFDIIASVLSDRLALGTDFEASFGKDKSEQPTARIEDGIAIIPITGSLMKKTSGLMAQSGCTSYTAIQHQFASAMQDAAVKGIVLDIDSPGGETSGLFELCDAIKALKGDKPVYAISNDSAYSAAYALASCADKIYITRTAGVGSIGVFCAHQDISKADEKAGIKYTFIHAGNKKTDGNSHEPLSDSAREDTQAEVDRLYGMFTSLVARSRKVAEQKIIDTQAGTFFGENAIPLLADKIGGLEEAIADLQAQTELNTHVPIAPLSRSQVIRKSGLDPAKIDAEIALERNKTATVKKATATKYSKQDEEPEPMAKKAEPSIEEIIAKHAGKGHPEGCQCDACKAEDEEAKKAKAADDDEDDDKKKKDEEDDEEEAKKASASDAVAIIQLCKLAGMPDLANEFILAGHSAKDVQSKLSTLRAGKSQKMKVTNNTSTSASDPATLFRAEFERLMADNSPNKPERFAKFIESNKAQYLEYANNRKGAVRQ